MKGAGFRVPSSMGDRRVIGLMLAPAELPPRNTSHRQSVTNQGRFADAGGLVGKESCCPPSRNAD